MVNLQMFMILPFLSFKPSCLLPKNLIFVSMEQVPKHQQGGIHGQW
jgi:hypothetical protein